MGIVSNDLDYLYRIICARLLDAPKVGNTRELVNVKLRLLDIANNIVSIRGLSPSYLLGELLWYFNGRNDLEFISKFSSFWNGLSDDGKTCNSAYGYRMKYEFDFDQIEKVIELLKLDPNSRRAVINLNVPNERVIDTKDEPCTIALQFLLRNGKLYCTTMMRSNDIWFGLPYDIAFFTELQKYIANRLGIKYGEYTHWATSLHMYDRDEEKIRGIVENPVSKPISIDSHRLQENYAEIGALIDRSKEPKIDVISVCRNVGIYKEG